MDTHFEDSQRGSSTHLRKDNLQQNGVVSGIKILQMISSVYYQADLLTNTSQYSSTTWDAFTSL